MIHNLEVDKHHTAQNELMAEKESQILDEHIKISLLIHKYHRVLLKNLGAIKHLNFEQRVDHLQKINQLHARIVHMGQEIEHLCDADVSRFSSESKSKIMVYVQQNKANWDVLVQCIETYIESLILLNEQPKTIQPDQPRLKASESSTTHSSTTHSEFTHQHKTQTSGSHISEEQTSYTGRGAYGSKNFSSEEGSFGKNLEQAYQQLYRKVSSLLNKTLKVIGRDSQGIQAKTDEKYMRIIIQLKEMMANQETAVYQVGAVLFVKYQQEEFCRVLTSNEINALNGHPELMQSAEKLLQNLPKILAEAQRLAETQRQGAL